jgi:16S rRNA processing protein RimM
VAPPEQEQREIVPIGHISGVHGIKGWVKIHSMTVPREAIFEYQPWMMREPEEVIRIKQGKRHGKHLIAMLDNVNDREQAETQVNRKISIYRDQFPELPEDEFYWADLIGLRVELKDGKDLGTIRDMLATGANDVMVVQGEKELLIPFVLGQYVHKVDLEQGVITADWDPEF